METKPNISFIIPVFNEELAKLKRCIESITSNTKNVDYEILLVDDGSLSQNSEKYKKIARELRVEYIHQLNGGVSSARNLGIDHAHGNYIGFIDSDDELGTIDYRSAVKTNADFLIFDIDVLNGKQQHFIRQNIPKKEFADTQKMLLDSVTSFNISNPFGKLYKTDFIKSHGIKFDTTLKQGEDYDFVVQVLYQKPTVYYIDQVEYLYHQQQSSSIKRLRSFPSILVDNYLHEYELKVRIVSDFAPNNTDLMQRIDSDLVKNMFSIMAEVLGLKTKEAYEARKKIISSMSKIEDPSKLSKMSKIKFSAMEQNNYLLLSILKVMRAFYIKLRY